MWERSWHAHFEIHSEIQGDKPEPNQYCRHPNLSSLLAHTRTNHVVCNWYEKIVRLSIMHDRPLSLRGPKSEHQKLGQGLAGRKEEPYGNVGSKGKNLRQALASMGWGDRSENPMSIAQLLRATLLIAPMLSKHGCIARNGNQV